MNGILASIPAKQILLFGLVGVLNTMLDFAVYNLLTRPPARFSRIRANLCSASVAMAFSFTVNALLVFQPPRFLLTEGAVKFVLVTAFSLYVLQNAVIYSTSRLWLGPCRLACALAEHFTFTRALGEEYICKNTVKGLATAVSLVWNFFWYKYFVYSD